MSVSMTTYGPDHCSCQILTLHDTDQPDAILAANDWTMPDQSVIHTVPCPYHAQFAVATDCYMAVHNESLRINSVRQDFSTNLPSLVADLYDEDGNFLRHDLDESLFTLEFSHNTDRVLTAAVPSISQDDKDACQLRLDAVLGGGKFVIV